MFIADGLHGHLFVGDMPGKQERILGLILEQFGFVDHGNQRARHLFFDLVRPLDLQHVVQDAVVDPAAQ